MGYGKNTVLAAEPIEVLALQIWTQVAKQRMHIFGYRKCVKNVNHAWNYTQSRKMAQSTTKQIKPAFLIQSASPPL